MMIIDLKYHFRLIRSSVEILMCKVKTFYNSLNSLIERPSDYKKATLMTVWYLSIMETLRQIGDSFDLSRGLAFRTIHKFIRVLSKLLNDFILWLKGSSITGRYEEEKWRKIHQSSLGIKCRE
ncbi:uncharacterized protein LOC112689937 isoform X1 [Sipha flava]|uniref:Uncharacterized protein LOC112689937 isoform X1 n=1 Tax=Sipha flava TaxID=143950 RepID=A0A8B8GAG9_9HEMI|nr:uncharacterized protein LOC112689937 isoform X1 [Sipha flava]